MGIWERRCIILTLHETYIVEGGAYIVYLRIPEQGIWIDSLIGLSNLPISLKLFSNEGILEFSRFPSIFMTSRILILITDIFALFFCCFQDTFHWSSSLTKKFKRNIKEELQQAMRTSSDIKVGKDRIFNKHLNASYPVTQEPLFIQYSMTLIIKWGKIAYLSI